jgi:molybdopterin molybdotransferase
MIPAQEAIDIVLRETGSLGAESISLDNTCGRVLAQDIVADCDLPPFDRSQMDGYAVIASDLETTPVTLKIIGESAAGHGFHSPIGSGEAVRIMTGAPVPPGADSVQKVELTSETDGGNVTIREGVKLGANIVRKGAEIRQGTTVFSAGERVSAPMIAVLASFGYSNVSVAQMPRVGILATGSEIVEVSEKPGVDQIRNSNAPMLAALAAKCGAEAHAVPLTDDDIEHLVERIASALENCDVLLITGGVSVGKYDLTKPALERLGAVVHFEKVRLKPGKPAVFATIGDRLIFGLPGNPVSAAVTFELFVRPALMKLQNATQMQMRTGTAVLGSDAKAAKERDTYLPASLATDESGRLVATLLRWQGSSDFIGYSRAEALIVLDAGRRAESGETAGVLFL